MTSEKADIVFVRVIIAVTFAALPARVSAQATRHHESDSLATVNADSSRSTDSFRLVSKRDTWMLTGAVIATASLAPFDHDIQRAFRAEDMRDNGSLRRGASALAFTGGPGPFVAGGLLYVAGEAAESPRERVFLFSVLHLLEPGGAKATDGRVADFAA